MTLSRKQFLQIFGITAVGVSVFDVALLDIVRVIPDTIIQGRTLLPSVGIYSEPNFNGIAMALHTDSIIPITDIQGNWYQTDGGYVHREDVQPIRPYKQPELISRRQLPVFSEVIGPVAAIRDYADPNATLVTRIGHGGVMTVTDVLPETRTGSWYQVTNHQGQALGWTQALHWQSVTTPNPHHNVSVRIDRTTCELTVFNGNSAVLTTPVNVPEALQTGTYTGCLTSLGGEIHLENGIQYDGVPYVMMVKEMPEIHLMGIHWHNDFGKTYTGTPIEMNTLAAKFIYTNAQDEFLINVT